MQQTLIQQGLDLLLYGMGTVFVFLTLLVIGVSLMSAIISRFFVEPEPEPASASFKAPTNQAPVDGRVLKVVQAAITQHRTKHKR